MNDDGDDGNSDGTVALSGIFLAPQYIHVSDLKSY